MFIGSEFSGIIFRYNYNVPVTGLDIFTIITNNFISILYNPDFALKSIFFPLSQILFLSLRACLVFVICH